MKLQNIYNNFQHIYYSVRQGKNLKITHIEDFLPFYYEPDRSGDYVGYDGTKLTKIYCKAPHEVKKQRTKYSYEADVLYTKRFLIENIDTIEKSDTRWIAYDIEVEVTEGIFPDPQKAESPVTFIVAYDNYEEEYKTWDYREFNTEYDMLNDFCEWVSKRQPDLLLAWNQLDFDYPYLWNRFIDLAKKLSPINMEQYRGQENPTLPALISVLDLLALDYKFTLGKRESYALDNVLQEEFEEEDTWGDQDWQDDEKVKAKCQNDVKRMIKLIEKNDYINFYDQLRIDTGCLWDDIAPVRVGYQWQSNNSKPIDIMFLREAKRLGVVLPSKVSDNERSEYEGAYREIYEKGSFPDYHIAVYDISSAYPSAIMDFCLDPATIKDEPNKNTVSIKLKKRNGEYLDTYYFEQNPNTILPTVVRKLLKAKDELKQKLNTCDPDSEEGKKLKYQYDSKKAQINSLYGVLANPYFRLFDKRIAETDTFLIRDLLHFVKNKIEENGYKIIYIDTDSVMIKSEEDLKNLLNKYVLEWSMDNYRINTNIRFEYQGHFEKLFLLALCRYLGYLKTPEGNIKKEDKGLQLKRKDATEFVKEFQENLLNFIMDGNGKDEVISFIKKTIATIEEVDLFKLGNPVKIQKPREDYKKKEIMFRALDSNQELEVYLNKAIGEKFWWINVNMLGTDVLAFDKKQFNHIKNIDYKTVIEKQIFNVLVPIFQNMEWGKELLDLAEEYEIILGSQYRNKLIEEYPDKEKLKKYYSAREAKKRLKKEKVEK